MNVFWREEPLNEDEARLLQLCFTAHAQSALRQNVSTAVLVEASRANGGDYTKALMAALCTLGGIHAPLMDTWRVLSTSDVEHLKFAIKSGILVPGWGSSFAKEDEEIWGPVEAHLKEHNSEIWSRVESITDLLKEKNLRPNPSTFTAAVGIALKMPPQMLPWIFITGRLNTWTTLFLETTMKGGK